MFVRRSSFGLLRSFVVRFDAKRQSV